MRKSPDPFTGSAANKSKRARKRVWLRETKLRAGQFSIDDVPIINAGCYMNSFHVLIYVAIISMQLKVNIALQK